MRKEKYLKRVAYKYAQDEARNLETIIVAYVHKIFFFLLHFIDFISNML